MKQSKSFLINALIFSSASIFAVSCQKNVSSSPGSRSITSQEASNDEVDCQKIHNPFTNFNNTPGGGGTPTSLWINVHTKLKATDLLSNGDFIQMTNAFLTLSNVTSTPAVSNTSIPDGIIIADATVAAPVTYFSEATSTWVTKVPVGYSSSDIFISGGIINSSTGFSVSSGKSSLLSASWSSNKGANFASSWFNGLACYQPQFSYSDIGSAGLVASVGGTGVKAGTPIPEQQYLVAGGSGGGGSNYTGSYSSTDNFVACTATVTLPPDEK